MALTKRQRSSNYSTDETMKLIHLVEVHRDIIGNKTTDGITWHDKNSAGEEIAQLFNASTLNHRTPDQLRQKYDSLKKNARKYAARQRQEALQTVGGEITTPENIIYETILRLILLSTVGLSNEFDSDCRTLTEIGTLTPQEEMAEVVLPDDIPIVFSPAFHSDNFSPSIPTVEIIDESNSAVEDEVSEQFSWDKYSPAMLKMPKHPALVIQQPISFKTSPSSAVLESSISTKSLGLFSATPHRTSKMSSSETTVQQVASEPTPVVGVSKDKPALQGKKTPTSITPQKWATRRRPLKKECALKVSATGQALQPWATARKNLAITQRNILLREHKANEKRKNQLFELQKANLLLEEKKLVLKMKIQEATLKKISGDESEL